MILGSLHFGCSCIQVEPAPGDCHLIGMFDSAVFETPEELDEFGPARVRTFIEEERAGPPSA